LFLFFILPDLFGPGPAIADLVFWFPLPRSKFCHRFWPRTSVPSESHSYFSSVLSPGHIRLRFQFVFSHPNFLAPGSITPGSFPGFHFLCLSVVRVLLDLVFGLRVSVFGLSQFRSVVGQARYCCNSTAQSVISPGSLSTDLVHHRSRCDLECRGASSGHRPDFIFVSQHVSIFAYFTSRQCL
jgi:hypothetical protein